MQLQGNETVVRSVAIEIDANEAFNTIRARILERFKVNPHWVLYPNSVDGPWFYWNLPQENPSKAAPATPEQMEVYNKLDQVRRLIIELEIK